MKRMDDADISHLLACALLVCACLGRARDAAEARCAELEGARLMALLEVDACRRGMLACRDVLRRAG